MPSYYPTPHPTPPYHSHPRPTTDAQVLRTGDYEVSSSAPYGQSPGAPVFHRSNAPASWPVAAMHGGGMNRMNAPQVAPHYGYQQAVPAPPNSVAPVAMNAARGAASTGSNRTVFMRERPSMGSGMMILLVGVLAGGLVGIAMRAHRNSVDAAAAQASPSFVAVQTPPAAVTPPVLQPAVTPPVQPAAAQPAAAQPLRAPVVAAVVPTQPPIVVTPPKTEAKVEVKSEPKPASKPEPKFEAKNDKIEKVEKKHAPHPAPAANTAGTAGNGSAHPRIATNVTPPKPEKPAPEKAAPEKPAKAGKEKAPNDAVNILKAAMGETENTL